MMAAAAAATSTCACDEPLSLSEEKLRQLELKLLAKLEEALTKSPPPQSFFLDTQLGVFLWSTGSNLVSAFLVCALVNSLCAVQRIWRFLKALRDIYSYIRVSIIPRPSHCLQEIDTREGATVLALRQGVTEATPADVERREEEIHLRQRARIAVDEALKNLFGRNHLEGSTLPMTNCEALAIACSIPQPAALAAGGGGSGDTPAAAGAAASRDAVNIPISVGINLPEATLTSDKQVETFLREARELLPPHTRDFRVASGSTFLSATVSVAHSAVEELLQCAICLVKLGLSYASICTVQLGNTALLYGTQPNVDSIEKTLLNEGLHDIPIITTAKLFEKRTIVIKGSYLENVEIKATTQSYGESFSLHVLYHQKLEKGLEVLLAQLPNGHKPLSEGTFVHAKKAINLESWGKNGLVLRSNDREVDLQKQKLSVHVTRIFCTWRLWICLLVLYTYQVMLVWPRQFFHMEWIFLLVVWCLCFIFIEFVIGPWTYTIITHCLDLVIRLKHVDHILMSRDVDDKKLCLTGNLQDSRARKSKRRGGRTIKNTRRDEDPLTEERAVPQLIHGSDFDMESDNEFLDSTTDGENEAKLRSPANSSDGEITTKVPVNDPHWEWPCFERRFQRGTWVTGRVAAKSGREARSSAKWPFEVETTVKRDGSESVQLIVRSPHLVRVLEDCQPSTDARFAEGRAIDPKELFLRLESLRRHIASAEADEIDTGAAAAVDDLSESQLSVWHVKHLLRFVERHFADTLTQYKRMKAEGCVSFEMLWTFFEPGERVRRKCLVTNQECFATVRHPAVYKSSPSGMYCSLKLNVMDFNVQSYHRCTTEYRIPPFDGEVPFTSLQVCPLRFFPDAKQMEAHFVSMGAIFYQVAMQQPFHFMQFKGSMNFYSLDNGCWALHKLNADGRVMVDLLSFARMNPVYPLGNAEPPCEVMIGMWSSPGPMKQPRDEELMLAPAFAYGFSFRLKKWGCFELCGLREIIFNEGAFGALRMKDESQKIILWSVVQPYIAMAGVGSAARMQGEQQLDPIANKGTGCIVLCHGPPGTGKTLTAEALAETMRCPLWSISAFELGEDPEKVEATLSRIMEVAHNWRAILLLDEADAYVQRRDEGVDVQRNLLTGVFLRVLEYHRGIMFLTTNRVTAFDDAILSRTTLAISYPALDGTQRREIWEKLLLRAGIRHHVLTDDALLHHDLNGRQIRNIVHLAQLLAAGRKQSLDITHVFDAINAYVSGTKDLPLPAAA